MQMPLFILSANVSILEPSSRARRRVGPEAQARRIGASPANSAPPPGAGRGTAAAVWRLTSSE